MKTIYQPSDNKKNTKTQKKKEKPWIIIHIISKAHKLYKLFPTLNIILVKEQKQDKYFPLITRPPQRFRRDWDLQNLIFNNCGLGKI